MCRVFGGDKGKLRQKGKHGVRGILGLDMNTEQLLYGVAKYGFHDGSVGFISVFIYFKE